MKLLQISDTHRKLDVIDELAGRARAEAVIHAGDFGFFDDGSYERLSDRRSFTASAEISFPVRK